MINKMRESGISLPCRRRPNMSIMAFLQVASTWTHYEWCAILFNKDTFYPNIDVKSIYLYYQDETCLIKLRKKNRNGSRKVFFHVPHVSDHQWADRSTTQCCFYISATSTSRRKTPPRSSFSLFVPLWFLKKLTWLQVISMISGGDLPAETTSVLLTKHFLTVPCLRRWALHHFGYIDPFQTHLVWIVHKHGAFFVPRKTLGWRPTD